MMVEGSEWGEVLLLSKPNLSKVNWKTQRCPVFSTDGGWAGH
jgi:hypothetical protein